MLPPSRSENRLRGIIAAASSLFSCGGPRWALGSRCPLPTRSDRPAGAVRPRSRTLRPPTGSGAGRFRGGRCRHGACPRRGAVCCALSDPGTPRERSSATYIILHGTEAQACRNLHWRFSSTHITVIQRCAHANAISATPGQTRAQVSSRGSETNPSETESAAPYECAFQRTRDVCTERRKTLKCTELPVSTCTLPG